ncbi:MAG: hypothetical protein EBT17_00090 [Actinobacteria bacterium]|nr:hypothetical protein [Actinomycetota bacterium]NDG76780.1 hypothetical protein [Acidimicrobiia bacterium]NBO33104.1 hypothetical protein [Actinomycetota bacterium]NBP17038.1 hypothetical protein [Actinomycetota bacterium]NBR75769.1 hypothetical protein [Actinomycetota bacterium]
MTRVSFTTNRKSDRADFDDSSLFASNGECVSLADASTLFRVSAPFEASRGVRAWQGGIAGPITSAISDSVFTTAMRLDSEVIEGRWQSASWGTLKGNFAAPLCGLRPSHSTVELRIGLVADVVDERLDRCTVMVDLLDLAVQTGQLLTAAPLGVAERWPLPKVDPSAGKSAETLEVVRAMQSDLHDDASTREQMLTAAHLRHWESDFIWAGPGGIGVTEASQGFVDHHQLPFRRAFPDRVGGGALPPGDNSGSTGHFVKFAQGAWAVTGGWPSVKATHTGNGWLGLPASNKPVTLRVFDFYEVTNYKITTNWVFIDIVDFLTSIGALPAHIHGYSTTTKGHTT